MPTAPIVNCVVPPNAFTILALSSNKLNVVEVVVKSPPSTAKSASIWTSPNTTPPVSLFRYLFST
jgi:hypothetical protein